MKFVLQQEFTFEIPVPVRRPDGIEQVFTGRFRVIPITPETKEVDIVEALEGWSGVAMPDNSELVVNPENRALLLRWPFVRAAVATAYMREISKVPEKNFAPPAAPGPAPAATAALNGAAKS